MPSRTANEVPQNEKDIDLLSYAQPDPDDLDYYLYKTQIRTFLSQLLFSGQDELLYYL